MYLIYAHEHTTVALQLLVDEVVDNSLFMRLDRIQDTSMHYESIVFLSRRRLNPWPTRNPVITHDYNQYAFASQAPCILIGLACLDTVQFSSVQSIAK